MYYIFGDIHGSYYKLEHLFTEIKTYIHRKKDTLIFVGDYIDRGPDSFEVVDFLYNLSEKYQTVFLKGNHEQMLEAYLEDKDPRKMYLLNGGEATIQSYKKHMGGSFVIPETHKKVLFEGNLFFEGNDFIVVHAGINPGDENIHAAKDEYDYFWIREDFYQADKKWQKTIIFGHTPTVIIHGRYSEVYFDEERNIIGIDTGAGYGDKLTCLRWPDKKVFQY